MHDEQKSKITPPGDQSVTQAAFARVQRLFSISGHQPGWSVCRPPPGLPGRIKTRSPQRPPLGLRRSSSRAGLSGRHGRAGTARPGEPTDPSRHPWCHRGGPDGPWRFRIGGRSARSGTGWTDERGISPWHSSMRPGRRFASGSPAVSAALQFQSDYRRLAMIMALCVVNRP